jgi:hypothetical protein
LEKEYEIDVENYHLHQLTEIFECSKLPMRVVPMLLFLSIFLAGMTLGVFMALFIFAPENQEELWDPQHFPETFIKDRKNLSPQPLVKSKLTAKPFFIKNH